MITAYTLDIVGTIAMPEFGVLTPIILVIAIGGAIVFSTEQKSWQSRSKSSNWFVRIKFFCV